MQIIDFLLNFFLCRLFTINFCIFRWFLLLWFLVRPFFHRIVFISATIHISLHISLWHWTWLSFDDLQAVNSEYEITNREEKRGAMNTNFLISIFFPSFLVWICLRFYNPYWNKHTPFGSLAAILFWTFLIAMYINVDLRSLSMRLMLSTTIFSML